jgi:hypothetical protein
VTLQWAAVAIIVPLCALYAAWALTAVAARRRISAWLAKGPVPAAWRRRLLQVDAAASACACNGCARPDVASAKPSAHAIVHLHRGDR